MAKQTTFTQHVASADGNYAWSNAANWTNGIPVDGDAVTTAYAGIDDLGSLHLAKLTEQITNVSAGLTRVYHGSLTVDLLDATSGTSLTADGFYGFDMPTVTINAEAAGFHGVLGARGVGATLINNSATDPNDLYRLLNGGRLDIAYAPQGSFFFGSAGQNNILALHAPGAVVGATIELFVGSSLELPGSVVKDVTITDSRITSVTTDAGTVQFTNFTSSLLFNIGSSAHYGAYSTSYDAASGLVSITLLAAEAFTPSGSGPALWSNAANWSQGVPLNGDGLTTTFNGVDDLASLHMSTLSDGAMLSVTSGSLSVDTYKLGGTLLADGSGTTKPVSIKIDTAARAITAAGGTFGAKGPHATFEDDSTTDRGGTYTATDGGRVDLYAAPAATSSLIFAGSSGTIALHGANASTAAALTIGAGDTIEVSGKTVSGVVFGANSLTITTDTGTTSFSNVSFRSAATTFIASQDAASGLEAITLKAAQMPIAGHGILSTIDIAPATLSVNALSLGRAETAYAAQLPHMLAMQASVASLFKMAT